MSPVAIRHLLQRPLPAFINAFYLALGVTCALLFLRPAQHEQGHDLFHADLARLFKIMNRSQSPIVNVSYHAVSADPIHVLRHP